MIYILKQYRFFNSIVYFIAVALTAGVFISERKEGLLDRSLVAGMSCSNVFFIRADIYCELVNFYRCTDD
jgi:hypothetical protein